ncbi:MAG TPA: hypothetical protein VGR28_10750 [Candidatus Thermoplasmatota archaeon]|jgi:hypothetical protein|nr:hypothetical protein [Candidatus Thermoplasmatota archaeon]
MKFARASLVSLAALMLLAPAVVALDPPGAEDVVAIVAAAMPKTGGPFNGVGSYQPAGAWDAPIFRQFAFVEGRVTQYHVLSPETFLMDAHHSHIYQFPDCLTLAPVLEKHYPVPGDGGFWGDHDAPTREIVDVVLGTGCSAQPRSVAEVIQLAAKDALGAPAMVETGLFVNAPVVPAQIADLPDNQLYSGPPFRPRITAWQEGVAVKFITYEASWNPTWAGINWPGEDGVSADVFMISYGAIFRPDFTIFNTAAGTPLDPLSFKLYSPMWKANCIVDYDNPKCMVSVNKRDPSYYQCRSAAECLQLVNSNGHKVLNRPATTFTHINCPMVAVDLNFDDYIDVTEELVFPSLWVNGPVIV